MLGLVAFLLLMVVALRVAWRLDPAYGSLAVAVLVSRLVQGQFDLFWAAVQGSLPFVVLGHLPRRQAGTRTERPRARRRPRRPTRSSDPSPVAAP